MMEMLALCLMGIGLGFFLGVAYCRTDDLIDELSRTHIEISCDCGDLLNPDLVHGKDICQPTREVL